MADGSQPPRLKKAGEVSFEISDKVNELIAKTTYEAPKIITYPVGKKKIYQPAYMGNL